MFIYKRQSNPRYGFFVLNRLNIENLNIPLTNDMEVQILGDYLIYKTPEGKRTLTYS